jgi:hypothetical protein
MKGNTVETISISQESSPIPSSKKNQGRPDFQPMTPLAESSLSLQRDEAHIAEESQDPFNPE